MTTTVPSMFQVNGKYSFDVFPAAILGNDFKNITVMGVIHSSIAQNYLDLEATHVQVYPYLPTGTPDDARGYEYVMFKTLSGEITVLGLPWISADTIVNVESGTMLIEVYNVTSQDIQRISDALIVNRYDQFKIKMKTT